MGLNLWPWAAVAWGLGVALLLLLNHAHWSRLAAEEPEELELPPIGAAGATASTRAELS